MVLWPGVKSELQTVKYFAGGLLHLIPVTWVIPAVCPPDKCWNTITRASLNSNACSNRREERKRLVDRMTTDIFGAERKLKTNDVVLKRIAQVEGDAFLFFKSRNVEDSPFTLPWEIQNGRYTHHAHLRKGVVIAWRVCSHACILSVLDAHVIDRVPTKEITKTIIILFLCVCIHMQTKADNKLLNHTRYLPHM